MYSNSCSRMLVCFWICISHSTRCLILSRTCRTSHAYFHRREFLQDIIVAEDTVLHDVESRINVGIKAIMRKRFASERSVETGYGSARGKRTVCNHIYFDQPLSCIGFENTKVSVACRSMPYRCSRSACVSFGDAFMEREFKLMLCHSLQWTDTVPKALGSQKPKCSPRRIARAF